MLFNSLPFVVFFAAVLAVVHGLRAWGGPRALRLRNGFLLLASYAFYSFWDWRFLGLIMLSTVVDYRCGLAMEGTGDDARRKRLVQLSLAVNLGLLGVFKYAGFFVNSAVEALTKLGLEADVGTLKIVLPVGISFYTFQTLSYTIDVYRRRMPAEPSALRFATYVAFFPQLVAGPIERARDLLPQFGRLHAVARQALYSGTWLMVWGLFKKVVIADNVGPVADAAFALDHPDRVQVLVGAYAFAVQIYCDFSGYTDVARGAARLLGFELSLNFNLPYVAQNPSDFWRRWHISLSSWLRDYLYIPLGGNRGSPQRTYINLMLTMLLGGLWHGAAWTFVAWGAFHGAILALYRLATPWWERTVRVPEGLAGSAVRLVNGVFFFQLVCISWVLFRAADFASVGRMFAGLGQAPAEGFLHSLGALADWSVVALVVAPLVLMQAGQHLTRDQLVVFRLPAPARAALYALGFLMFLYLGDFGGEAFIYFQF